MNLASLDFFARKKKKLLNSRRLKCASAFFGRFAAEKALLSTSTTKKKTFVRLSRTNKIKHLSTMSTTSLYTRYWFISHIVRTLDKFVRNSSFHVHLVVVKKLGVDTWRENIVGYQTTQRAHVGRVPGGSTASIPTCTAHHTPHTLRTRAIVLIEKIRRKNYQARSLYVVRT